MPHCSLLWAIQYCNFFFSKGCAMDISSFDLEGADPFKILSHSLSTIQWKLIYPVIHPSRTFGQSTNISKKIFYFYTVTSKAKLNEPNIGSQTTE
jgi:hypothetical protein